MPTSIPDRLASLRAKALDPTTLALWLTLLTLLLRPVGVGWLRYAVVALAITGLVSHRVMRLPALWWLLTALCAIRVISDWPMADNHAYLLCYWLLAIALYQSSTSLDDSLARNARWLIGLTFAFASLWKVVLSPDYLDGTFFRVTLATDPRLEAFTRSIGGLSSVELNALREHLQSGGSIAHAPEPDRYRRVALLATGWNVVLNVTLAFVFLGTARIRRTRNALLMAYCVVTYAFATVDGFAWLLISMGVAQTEPAKTRVIAGFATTFVLIFVYRQMA